MNPVLKRELLVQARAWQTRWLRVLGGALGLLLLIAATSSDPSLFATSGQSAFIGLNKLLVVFVWVVAPILTADCLSQEKREGTMGLLFLTPLSARQIVVAKASVHSLRIFTIILAAYPVLMLPLLFGGVTWQDAVRLGLLHLASITFALSAGLAASSLTSGWLASRALALGFAFMSALTFISCYLGWVSYQLWASVIWLRRQNTLAGVFIQQWQAFSHQIGLHGGGFAWFWHGAPSWAKANDRVVTTALAFASTLVLSFVTVQCAAAALTRTWRPASDNTRWLGWQRHLSNNLKNWCGRHSQLLEVNPIAWQQWHSSRFQVGTIAACLFASIPIGYAWLARARPSPIWFADLLFYGMIAWTAPAGFRQDRDNGLMEPLLVTPLGKRTLIRGRFLGIIYTWMPAAILYALSIFIVEAWFIHGPFRSSPAGPGLLDYFGPLRELFHRLAWPGAIAAMGLFGSTIRVAPGLVLGITLFFFAIIPLSEFAFQFTSPNWWLLAATGVKELLVAGAFLWTSLYLMERKLVESLEGR